MQPAILTRRTWCSKCLTSARTRRGRKSLPLSRCVFMCVFVCMCCVCVQSYVVYASMARQRTHSIERIHCVYASKAMWCMRPWLGREHMHSPGVSSSVCVCVCGCITSTRTHALPRAHTHAHTRTHTGTQRAGHLQGHFWNRHRGGRHAPARDTSLTRHLGIYACSKVLSLVTLYCKYVRAQTFENFYRPWMAFVRAHIYISIYIHVYI